MEIYFFFFFFITVVPKPFGYKGGALTVLLTLIWMMLQKIYIRTKAMTDSPSSKAKLGQSSLPFLLLEKNLTFQGGIY